MCLASPADQQIKMFTWSRRQTEVGVKFVTQRRVFLSRYASLRKINPRREITPGRRMERSDKRLGEHNPLRWMLRSDITNSGAAAHDALGGDRRACQARLFERTRCGKAADPSVTAAAVVGATLPRYGARPDECSTQARSHKRPGGESCKRSGVPWSPPIGEWKSKHIPPCAYLLPKDNPAGTRATVVNILMHAPALSGPRLPGGYLELLQASP